MMQADSRATRPGWYYGWNIVAVCILSQIAANGLTYNAYSLFLRDWSNDLAVPISRLQLPIAAMALVAALLSPLVGTFADKYPPRRLFAIGLLGMASFYLAISWVTSAWQIIVLYGLLVPLALALSTAITANALISRWFVRRIGLALGLSAFGVGMAGVLLPPVIAALLPEIGWRMVWRGGGLIVALLIMPAVVLVIRNRPTEREGLQYLAASGGANHRGHGHGTTSGELGWRDVLKRRNFWILVGVYLPMMAVGGGYQQNLVPYAEAHGLTPQDGATLLSILSFAHVVATLAFGLISDRVGNRLPFAGLCLVIAAGAAVLAFGSGLPVIAVGSVLVGLGGGVFTLLSAATAAEFGTEGFGRAFGLILLFVPVNALVPFMVARWQESSGSYAPPLVALGVLVTAAGALALLLRERHDGHLAEAEHEAMIEEAVTPMA